MACELSDKHCHSLRNILHTCYYGDINTWVSFKMLKDIFLDGGSFYQPAKL